MTDADDLVKEAEAEDTEGQKSPDKDKDFDAAIEARARRLGWTPEAEWDETRAERSGIRKPVKFLTAQEFIDRVESDLPVMRERIRHTDSVIVALEKKLGTATSKLDEMHEVLTSQREMSLVAVKRAREAGRAEAKAEMRRSVEDGDTAAYEKAQKRLDDIEAEERAEQSPKKAESAREEEPKTETPRNLNPAVEAWVKKNLWFRNDMVLNTVMIDAHQRVQQENPDMDMLDSLEQAKSLVQEKFPEKFGINPRRAGASAVNRSTGHRGSGNGIDKAWSEVPESEKQTYEKHRKMFEGRGQKYTKEEFLKEGGYIA
jgi:hypothetical protein